MTPGTVIYNYCARNFAHNVLVLLWKMHEFCSLGSKGRKQALSR